jgi:hypothetical protein
LSEIRATTISDSAGTGPITLTGQSAAKAYYYFDQSLSPNVTGDTFNTSSLVDFNTGQVTHNMTSSFSGVKYVVGYMNNQYNQSSGAGGRTVSSYRVASYNISHTVNDGLHYGTVDGDLA